MSYHGCYNSDVSRRRNPLLRFYAKVLLGDGCWEWQASRVPAGYGLFRPGGTAPYMYAHRWAWAHWNGPIPDGLDVLHHCDNPKCVRQDHLYAGTQSQNNLDAYRRGRHPGNGNREKTHCRNGHEFNEANTRHARGERVCRVCAREHMRRVRAARRG